MGMSKESSAENIKETVLRKFAERVDYYDWETHDEIEHHPKRRNILKQFTDGVMGYNYFWGWFLSLGLAAVIIVGIAAAIMGVQLTGEGAVLRTFNTILFVPLALTLATMLFGSAGKFEYKYRQEKNEFLSRSVSPYVKSLNERAHANTVPDADSSFAIHLSFSNSDSGKQSEIVEIREYKTRAHNSYRSSPGEEIVSRVLYSEKLPSDITEGMQRVSLLAGIAEDMEREVWERQHGRQVDAQLRQEMLLQAAQARSAEEEMRQELLLSAKSLGTSA
jgi:hypothetical protein